MSKGKAFRPVFAVLVMLGTLVVAFELQNATRDTGGGGGLADSSSTVPKDATGNSTSRAAAPSANAAAPEFELRAMDDSVVRSSALNGEVVVVVVGVNKVAAALCNRTYHTLHDYRGAPAPSSSFSESVTATSSVVSGGID